MASRTLDVGAYFAPGVTLNAYQLGTTDNPDGLAPTSTAVSSATVSSTGTVTFNGLADGTGYWAGTGNAPYNYLSFKTPDASGSVSVGGGVTVTYNGSTLTNLSLADATLTDLGGYAKPGTGIPEADLASAVVTKLNAVALGAGGVIDGGTSSDNTYGPNELIDGGTT